MDERHRGLDRRQPVLQNHRGEESLEATHGTERVVRPRKLDRKIGSKLRSTGQLLPLTVIWREWR